MTIRKIQILLLSIFIMPWSSFAMENSNLSSLRAELIKLYGGRLNAEVEIYLEHIKNSAYKHGEYVVINTSSQTIFHSEFKEEALEKLREQDSISLYLQVGFELKIYYM
jgi:hypothetical protein